jgi:hypothetical protein
MKRVVGSLLQEKGLSWTNIATKLVALCLDGISVSQGVKSSVMKHIWKTCAPFNLGVHYVFQKKHLDVHTLSSFPFMHQVETLLQSSYQYFCKSSKCHLEFTKLATIMETKGPKLLRNVKTKWISMLSLTKWVITKNKTLLMKMAINMYANSQATTKFEHLVDLDMLLSLFYILPFLEFVHNLLKFSQYNDIFLCNFVSAVKICQAQLYY